MQRKRRSGLEVRLAAVTVVAVLLGGVLILAFAQRRVLPDVEGLRVAAVELSVNATTAEIDALTARMERHVEGVALTGEELHELRHETDQAGVPTAPEYWRDFVQQYLAQSAEGFPDAFGNGLWFEPHEWDPAERFSGFTAQVDEDGVATSTVDNSDYLSEAWYEAAILPAPEATPGSGPPPERFAFDLVWTRVYYDETAGEPVQTVDAVMRDGDRIIGLATTDWTLREMTGLLEDLRPTPGARAFLVDPLSQTLVTIVGSDELGVPLADTEIGRQLNLLTPTGTLLRQELEVDGEPSQVFARRSTSGLLVGLVVPTSDIGAPVEEIRTQVLLAILAGVAVAAVLGLLGVHQLLLPLSSLTRAVDEVAEGDLDAQVSEEGHGELGLLSRSFNRMTRELRGVTRRHDDKVRELEVAQEALVASERRYRTILETVGEGIVALDADRCLTYVNPAAAEVLGFGSDELLGTPLSSLAVLDDRETLDQFLEAPGSDEPREDLRFTRSDGSMRWCSVSVRSGALDDPEGALLALRDVTERKSAEEQLRRLALYDPLTGLANRGLLHSQLETHLGRLSRDLRRSFAVLFIDCDRFKLVNDAYGHLVGDELLLEVARRIAAAVRPGDLVARFGGDEFVVLLEGVARAGEAEVVARRVLSSVSGPCQVKGHEISVTASIGTVFVDDPAADAASVLREADIAMYEAKGQGRHRVVLYEPRMSDAPASRLSLEAELRRAIERDEITLRYQPIVAVGDRTLLGFEALARWEHPLEGTIPPSRFIDVAEDSGLIVPLGWRVVEMACAEAASWSDRSTGANGGRRTPPPYVAVNLSRRQLTEPKLVARLAATLEASGLDPARLHVEITESLMMQDVLAETGVLTDLKALGVRVVIDDFGTGYSSLAVLHRLPFDGLKIDRSFIRSIGAGGRQERVVSTIVRLANELGVHSVAEGVESDAQWAGLAAMGCEAAQGYLLGRPMAATEAMATPIHWEA